MFLFAGKSSQNSFSVIQLSHVFQNTEDTELKSFSPMTWRLQEKAKAFSQRAALHCRMALCSTFRCLSSSQNSLRPLCLKEISELEKLEFFKYGSLVSPASYLLSPAKLRLFPHIHTPCPEKNARFNRKAGGK